MSEMYAMVGRDTQVSEINATILKNYKHSEMHAPI